jgi:hypothetical protein
MIRMTLTVFCIGVALGQFNICGLIAKELGMNSLRDVRSSAVEMFIGK